MYGDQGARTGRVHRHARAPEIEEERESVRGERDRRPGRGIQTVQQSVVAHQLPVIGVGYADEHAHLAPRK